MATTERRSTRWRGAAVGGTLTIILTFGVIGTWAAVASLDSAVIAGGTISVETNRKTMQHLEGGIVRTISVLEGDAVEKDQLLFTLDDTAARANVVLLSNQMATFKVQEVRLMAERDGRASIDIPQDVQERANEVVVAQTIRDQIHQFEERRRSLNGQISVLQSRVVQLRNEIAGLMLEKSSNEKQVGFISKELIGMRSLLEKNLIPVTRVYAHEREHIRLEGTIGRTTADIAKAEGAISEVALQIQQLSQKFQEDVAANLIEVRTRISDLNGRLNVANDILSRTELRAPRAGVVQNLKVWTLGQVIRSGEALLEIVPTDEPLIVQVQIMPQDVNVVSPGLVAEVRFPSFHARTIPTLFGKVERISRDRLIDEATRQPYFLGLVSVDRTQLPKDINQRLSAGMPAELIIGTGERTVLQYLVQPLTNSLRKVGREQ
ncbi:AcrA Membrane-fusion protein [Rhabdaerophilaceae bacterium]